MPECTRTFIAIALPDSVEQALCRFQDSLAPEIPECRWTRAVPFHVTLAFLGDLTFNDLSEVRRGIASSVVDIESFEIEVVGLGAFPTALKPRVIWAGVAGHGKEKLIDLQRRVTEELAGIGRRPNDPRFHPHVTLGRIKYDRRARPHFTRLEQKYSGWSAGPCLVQDIRVFASTLGPTGSVYKVLGRSALAGKKAEEPA